MNFRNPARQKVTVTCSQCEGIGKLAVLDKRFQVVQTVCSICKGKGFRVIVVNLTRGKYETDNGNWFY